MQKINLEDAIRAAYQRRFDKLPARHSQQTDDCPHMATYIQIGLGDWPAELKEHARSCQFCQKSMEAVWTALEHHPSESEINDPNYINAIAVGHHINWAGCESCAKKVHKT